MATCAWRHGHVCHVLEVKELFMHRMSPDILWSGRPTARARQVLVEGSAVHIRWEASEVRL